MLKNSIKVINPKSKREVTLQLFEFSEEDLEKNNSFYDKKPLDCTKIKMGKFNTQWVLINMTNQSIPPKITGPFDRKEQLLNWFRNGGR